jgi:hypothetical protein
MTGRGAGFCAGYSMPGYSNPVRGKGFCGAGHGRGGFGGRGYGNRYYQAGLAGWQREQMGYPARGGYANAKYATGMPQVSPEEEIKLLKDQAKAVKQELDAVNKRIKELESAGKSKK